MQNRINSWSALDVGSTTVKAVVVDRETDQMIWQDYQRHETKQPEKSLEFLQRMEAEVGIDPSKLPRSSSPARAAAPSPT